MEQERCYVCRRWIPEGQVFRRLLPTAHYTGGNLGTASGVFAFTRSEVVSLCAGCDAAEAARLTARPHWLRNILVAWCMVWVGISAFFHGYWLVGIVWASFVLWRLSVRWPQRRTPAVATSPTTPPGQHPTRLTDRRVVRAPREWLGDGDA